MNKRTLFKASTDLLIALPPVVSLYSVRAALIPVLFEGPLSAFLSGVLVGVCLTTFAILLGTSIFEGELE